MKKIKVGVLGATGMVGQHFITLLNNHRWFEVVSVAASSRSAGKTYQKAVTDKWTMSEEIPASVADLTVREVTRDMDLLAEDVDFVFSALDMEKEQIRFIEESYASLNVPVVSNNSAHRWTEDVPMIIPEVNPHHAKMLDKQKKHRGWEKGFIAVKPNCSIQSYVAILTALWSFQPEKIRVTSMQAISGAGKTFETWPEMIDNVIPLIGGEEEKSEKEPMKIWSDRQNLPEITATCIRVPVTDGHMANVSVEFAKDVSENNILQAIEKFENPITKLKLPSAPKQFIKYIDSPDRPQTNIDRDFGNGMGITMGRLRKGKFSDWQFIALSHNTVRGAAGGAILMAELLKAKGYLF
jgi:aspartate-semialdehyde dehydrogenase